MDTNSNVCPLCGNPFLEKDSACSLCGGRKEFFFGLNLGYIYPAEAKVIRNFILYFLVSIVLFFVAGYSLWSFFESNINFLD